MVLVLARGIPRPLELIIRCASPQTRTKRGKGNYVQLQALNMRHSCNSGFSSKESPFYDPVLGPQQNMNAAYPRRGSKLHRPRFKQTTDSMVCPAVRMP